MKKFVLLLSFIFVASLTFAQVSEAKQSMSQGNYNGFAIDLRKTVKKDVEKAWKKYIKKYDGKTKKNKKTNETFSDNAEIEGMSTNTVDVYASVRENGEDTKLVVWFDLGGAYLSSETHPKAAAMADKMLNDFAMSVSKASIEEELEVQEKLYKKIDGDLKDLVKDKSGLESDIKKYEKKIAEAKSKIEENLKAQAAKKEELETKGETVERVKKKLNDLR
ncbi:MAG: hypothetical protein AB8G15_01140 [Saprospiraceae bacterium]